MAIPDWQSLLFVPVGADRHLTSAIRHRPDAIILDLEDAVAPQAKALARARLGQAQAAIASAGIACILRVNGPLRQMVADLDAADPTRLAALMVPKCEDSYRLRNAAELTGGTMPLVALVETPAALARLPDIALVPAVVALMFGSEDYSASLGVDPNGGALDYPAAQIAIACAARGLLAIGFPGSIANFSDLDLYARQIARGRALGLRAVAAIHPAQLPVIAACLAPGLAEIAWAQSVVGQVAARAGDQAVFASEGSMIDAPVVARAEAILRAAARTAAKPMGSD